MLIYLQCVHTGDDRPLKHRGRSEHDGSTAESTTRAGGIRVGSYRCVCRQGLYLPASSPDAVGSISYLNGSFLERLYHFRKGKNRREKPESRRNYPSTTTNKNNEINGLLEDLSAYEYLLEGGSVVCLPCAVVCEGSVWCTHHPPCSMVGDLAFRLPLVLLTMVTMIGAGCLLVLTFKFRNDKVHVRLKISVSQFLGFPPITSQKLSSF